MIHVPILTYHANNINGMDYHNNDHVALADDLRLIKKLGLRIISLDQLMDWRFGKTPNASVENSVVLTCDDGTNFDYHDLEHPTCGLQSSFFNLLKTHQTQTGQPAHMTNFVIVSPAARVILDQKCLIGKDWWTDDWWQNAQDSGLMHIANHSWDHNHGVLDNQNFDDDSFRHINTKQQCDQQIRQAQDYLHQQIGNGYQVKYFAYPYGNYSEYLRFQYLPLFSRSLQLIAAFTTDPNHVNIFSKIWAMPRYVCNNDWRDSSGLEKILKHQ